MPDFLHCFEDASGRVFEGTTHLTVREIEDAGVREILQTPGAALGTWKFLDALLDPLASTFRFQEPLGHAREVKTAVSGLFGRFVARAYAVRYLGLTHFDHVRKPPMVLNRPMNGILDRVPGMSGDMPDWVAWGRGSGLAIVEAKGCHDSKGPQAALDRADAQAARAEIRVNGHLAPFKRYAVATRWGFTRPKMREPMLWVKDPDEDGMLTDAEREALELAVVRRQAAALLAPLGHGPLAQAVLDLDQAVFPNLIEARRERAREILYSSPRFRIFGEHAAPDAELVGGFVTRLGPLGDTPPTRAQLAVLRDVGLRPMFVGIERSRLKQAVEGFSEGSEKTAVSFLEEVGLPDTEAGADGSGSWVVHIDGEADVEPLGE